MRAGQDQVFETKSADVAAKLAGMPITEPFDASSVASFTANWAQLGWSGGTSPKGAADSSGWHPLDAFPTVNGAFSNQALVDSGWGLGAAATMATAPGIEIRYFSLWLDMPTPTATTRSGYSLRFTNITGNTYTVALLKWVNGTQTELASKPGVTFLPGNSLALVDLGGTVSAWTDTGSGYTQLLSASESTYEGGKAGLEASGNNTRLTKFKAGALVFAKAVSEVADPVRGTTAVLHGSVNPQGSPTTYQFEIGPSDEYGTSVPTLPASAGSGTGAVPVGGLVGGLEEGQTYHYRLVATSAGGTTFGEDMTLKTAKKPTVTMTTAASVKATSASLTATVNPEGSATTYQFEYGPTAAYGSKAPAAAASAGASTTAVGVGQSVSGLTQGTTYHYRVIASNAAGTSFGEDRTLTTLKLPKASTGTVTSLKSTNAVLNATVTPEGTATTYQFEYGPTVAYGFKAPAAPLSVGAGSSGVAVSQTAGNLIPGTTYHYRVVATSAAGTVNGEDKVLVAKTSETATLLGTLPVTEPFDGTTSSITNFASNWAMLGWAVGFSPKGTDDATGWHPTDPNPLISGAYYNQAVNDSGWGVGTAATMTANPSGEGRYLSLWLDMPAPNTTSKAGYELRYTYAGLNLFNVVLAKWVGGTQTVLGTKAGYSMAIGSTVALVDLGGVVSAWTNTGSGYTQLLTASDSTYEGGKAGLEASGNVTRLIGFKHSSLKAPPKATTNAATNVKMDQATLSGSVNPQGFATTYQFEYGATASYGSKIPATATSIGSGTSNVAVSQAISGLTSGITYHYRVVATSETGTTYGEDKTFIPPSAPSYQLSFGTFGATAGQFSHPAGIAVDSGGNLWVVDQDNARLEKFSSGGAFLSQFGSPGSGNGQFSRPTDVAVDSQGNIWVTDAGNSRVQKFSSSGEYLIQFGSLGSAPGQLKNAESLAIDPSGNVWVADTYNGRLQKFSPTGELLKVVGSYGTGQGQMIEPTGIDIGLGGTVWVADWGNQRVAEFSETGEFIRQFGSEGTSGGQFKRPDVIEVDAKGRVWVGDQNNSRIQRFSEVGTYVSQFGIAGAGAGQFSFGWPMGLASDAAGNLWISDTGNNRVQRWG